MKNKADREMGTSSSSLSLSSVSSESGAPQQSGVQTKQSGSQTMTALLAGQMVKDAGHTVLAAFEDDRIVYAGSVKSVLGTLGHPVFEVHYSKDTGWLSVSGKSPVKLQDAKG